MGSNPIRFPPTRLRQLQELSETEGKQSGPGFQDFAKDPE